jgi:chromosome segregation ATPase
MIWATDLGVVLGSTGTFIAALVGAVAFFQTRRTEHKTATREEVKQAFDLQDLAMVEVRDTNTRLTLEIARVRGKNDAMHETLNSTFAKMAELKAEHTKCTVDLDALGAKQRKTEETLTGLQDALHIAEAKIAELGG